MGGMALLQYLQAFFNPRRIHSSSREQRQLQNVSTAPTQNMINSTTLYHLHNATLFGNFEMNMFKNRWFFDTDGLKNCIDSLTEFARRENYQTLEITIPTDKIMIVKQKLDSNNITSKLQLLGEKIAIICYHDDQDKIQYYLISNVSLDIYGAVVRKIDL